MTVEQGQPTLAPADAFRFGRNWQRYLSEYANPERERIAAQSLGDLLELDLAGRSFLDIGCGSGLFSLCAHKAGAKTVISLDVDTSGKVSAARAISGPPVLRAAALDAVKRWKYQPAMLGDKAVVSTEVVKVQFKLR